MDEDTLIQVEDRTYANPQTGLDERMQFIDTLRDVQAQNTAEINQNTYNLGSPVTSNVGGLGGSEALWQTQYQTPQVNAQIADLRTVTQQQALNQELQNLQDVYQNQYRQARRNYYARAKAKADAANPNNTNPTNLPDPDVDTQEPEESTIQTTITSNAPNTLVMPTMEFIGGIPVYGVYDKTQNPPKLIRKYTVNPETGKEEIVK